MVGFSPHLHINIYTFKLNTRKRWQELWLGAVAFALHVKCYGLIPFENILINVPVETERQYWR